MHLNLILNIEYFLRIPKSVLFHSVTLAELLAKIHKYCLPIDMTYCVHSKKPYQLILYWLVYVYILEVYLRIFTFSSFS